MDGDLRISEFVNDSLEQNAVSDIRLLFEVVEVHHVTSSEVGQYRLGVDGQCDSVSLFVDDGAHQNVACFLLVSQWHVPEVSHSTALSFLHTHLLCQLFAIDKAKHAVDIVALDT